MSKNQFVAFLRGLNVGGHGVIRMAELAQLFERCGATAASTFIQSGNVLFEAAPVRVPALMAKVQAQMQAEHQIRTRVIWRSLNHLTQRVAADPFAAYNLPAQVKPHIMFLQAAPAKAMRLPLASKLGDVELLGLHGADVLLVTRPLIKSGGDIDALARAAFGDTGTTRALSTLQRLLVWAAGA